MTNHGPEYWNARKPRHEITYPAHVRRGFTEKCDKIKKTILKHRASLINKRLADAVGFYGALIAELEKDNG